MRIVSIVFALFILGVAQRYADGEARKHLWSLRQIFIRSALYQSLAIAVALPTAILLEWVSGHTPNPEPVTQPYWVWFLLVGCYLFVVGKSIYDTYQQVECERIERGDT